MLQQAMAGQFQDVANLGWGNFAKVSQSLQELYVLIEKSFFAMLPKTC